MSEPHQFETGSGPADAGRVAPREPGDVPSGENDAARSEDTAPLRLEDSSAGDPAAGDHAASNGSARRPANGAGDGPNDGSTSSAGTRAAPAPSVRETETQLAELSKGGTNLDTLVGRLVVEQGLATEDEVRQCLELSRAGGPPPQGVPAPADGTENRSERSLAQLLVDNAFVTSRQIARLRQIIEAERSGQAIPGYKILGKLGAGAMATVFKAKQISLDRTVAIKILPRRYSSNPQFIERFYAEGRAAAQLNHPNIVQAFDVGKAGEYHYFVMEYVEGRTVHDDITRHKRFQESEAINVAIQVAEALLHAHDRGLIHRDVKPKNIMITKEEVVKLADMGLARAISDKEAAEAEAGKAFGTPYYISPEQIRGETTVGPPADIYSLGATIYHMVTGSVPFEGKNPSAVMHKHLKSRPVPPDHVNPKLSAGISEVIEMMMAKRPGDRYQNCRDLLIDLRAIRSGEPPPMAHKETFAEQDLASLAAAEAAAEPAAIQPPSREPAAHGDPLGVTLRHPLTWVLVFVLILSLTVHVWQAMAS